MSARNRQLPIHLRSPDLKARKERKDKALKSDLEKKEMELTAELTFKPELN